MIRANVSAWKPKTALEMEQAASGCGHESALVVPPGLTHLIFLTTATEMPCRAVGKATQFGDAEKQLCCATTKI
ncbi:MAG: hypothetical protein LBS65_01600, partial [Desulfovibrio sp.]|nr:hypothetical protein [Desulfovibrio sp.]